MRRAIRAFACAVALVAALCAPALAAPANGQLAAVADGRLVTVNADGSGLRTLPVAGRGSDHRARLVARTATGSRSSRRAEIIVSTSRRGRVADAHAGARATPTRRGRRTGRRSGSGAARRLLAVPGGRRRTASRCRSSCPPARPPSPGRRTCTDVRAVVAAALLSWPGCRSIAAGGRRHRRRGRRTAARSRSRDAGGLSTITPRRPAPTPVARGAAPGSPRWSPDATRAGLSPPAARCARSRARAAWRRRGRCSGRAASAAVDWQPCVAGRDAELRVGRAAALQRAGARPSTTQADQPVDLPAPPCTDPAARAADARRRQGARTTARSPACATRRRAGFSGQDTRRLPRQQRRRASPRSYRVTVFVVPRPRAAAPPPATPAAGARPGRAVPERARDAAAGPQAHDAGAGSSCDQDCSLAVRLTGDAAHQARRSRGPQVKRSIAAERVRARCGCGCRPSRAGTLKTVWITGARAQRGRRRRAA